MKRLKIVGIVSSLLVLAAVIGLALPGRHAASRDTVALQPYILLPPGAPETSGAAHEPAGVTPLQSSLDDASRATPSAPGRTGGSPTSSLLSNAVEYVGKSVKSAVALVSSPVSTPASTSTKAISSDPAAPANAATRWTVIDVPASEVQRLSQPGARNNHGPIASLPSPLVNREENAPVVDTDADWYSAPADESPVANGSRSTHGRAAVASRKALPVRDAGNAAWYDSLDAQPDAEEGATSSLEDSLLAGIDRATVFSSDTRSASRSGVPSSGVRRSRGGAGMAPALRALTNNGQSVAACSTDNGTRFRLVKLAPAAAPEERLTLRVPRPAGPSSSLPPVDETAAPSVVLASLGPALPGTGATDYPGFADVDPEESPKPTTFCPIGLVEKKTKGERFCARADKTGITFREGPVSFLYPNGKKKAQGTYVNGKLEGAYVEFATNGKKTAEGEIHKGAKNGEWSFWWDDGKKQSQGTFVNGERTGKWVYWDEKGRRLYEGEIRTVGNVEKKQGTWTFFHANGKKKQEGTFVGGKKEGTWKTFDEKGKQVSVLVYRDGEEEIR